MPDRSKGDDLDEKRYPGFPTRLGIWRGVDNPTRFHSLINGSTGAGIAQSV
jgi:hypothetical protein